MKHLEFSAFFCDEIVVWAVDPADNPNLPRVGVFQRFLMSGFRNMQKWNDQTQTDPAILSPSLESQLGRLADFQSFLKPVQNFTFNPSHSVRAKLYPLWEFACLFQPCDVLR